MRSHWSKLYYSFITIEIEYSNGSRQGWGYDCNQFENFDQLKLNLAIDFATQPVGVESLFVFASGPSETVTADLGVPKETGDEFASLVLDSIGGIS